MRRARRLAGAGAAEFAKRLRIESGEPVTPHKVRAWEDGVSTPSAEVLLAAADVAGVELELLFCRRQLLKRLEAVEHQVERQSHLLHGLSRYGDRA
jgi:transcriptional regulator with XRE-family HTH domain